MRREQRVVGRWMQPQGGERRESCIGGGSPRGERAESRASVEAAPGGESRGSCIGGDSLGGESAESRASVETASEILC